MTYKTAIVEKLTWYVKSHGLDIRPNVDYSSFEDFDYQTSIAMQLRDNPVFNPQHLVDFLFGTGAYEKVAVTGKGFISIKVKLLPLSLSPSPRKRILLDYCGVNVAKQMHIGHIRSMFIGDFVSRLHEHNADDVVIQNHIGDFGNQFGYLIGYIMRNGLSDSLTSENLTKYYKAAYAEHEAGKYLEESEKIASQLQADANDEIRNLHKKICEVSMHEVYRIFDELNLHIAADHTRGESFYAHMCQNILDDLVSKGIAVIENDGSVIVRLDDQVTVLRKSNQNFLYSLFDIAAIKFRVEYYDPDKIVYVVDNRQKMHFEQVFEIAKLAGYAKDVELTHLGFGTILGKDKKPLKTRSGDALYLRELLDEGKEILSTNGYFVDMNESYKDDIMNKTLIGGLKLYDLMLSKEKDYIFDWNNVLNFSGGGSAPYIQYALVRIDSIFFKKFGMKTSYEKLDFDHSWTSTEHKILFSCQKTHEIISDLLTSYKNHTLVAHTIELAGMLHRYVYDNQIVGSSDEQHRLQLLMWIENALTDCCDILGIETYSCIDKLELKDTLAWINSNWVE